MNTEQLIEVDATDIDAGLEPDGLPKTVPAQRAKATPKVEVNPELEEAKRINSALLRERNEFAASTHALRTRLEAQERESEEMRGTLDNRTTQALRSHWRAVSESRERAEATHNQVLANIVTQKALQTTAERELQAAIEAQEPTRITQAHRTMAEATSQLTALERDKIASERAMAEARQDYDHTAQQYEQMRRQREQPDPEPQGRREERPQPQMTPEQWIDQHPQATAEWLHQHKDFVTDQTKHMQLQQFGEDWVRKFGRQTLFGPEFVNELKRKFTPEAAAQEPEGDGEVEEPEVEVKEQARAASQSQSKSAPAAPVSRSAAPARSSSQGLGKISLTAEQHAIAPDVIPSFDDLDQDLKDRFKVWSPTAARYQYDRNVKRANSDGKMLK